MRQLLPAICAMLVVSCTQKEDVAVRTAEPAIEETKLVALGTSGTLAEGNGKAVVSMHCVACHSVDVIRQQRLTPKQWTATIEKMEKWGAPLPQNDRAAVIAYLSTHYGPANHFVPYETPPKVVAAIAR